MRNILDLFKKKPQTYRVRIYNKHFDDDSHYLMGNHEIEKELLDTLMNVDQVNNQHQLTFSIDKRLIDMSNEKIVYVFYTSTIWSIREEKPSCYTKQWFIKSEYDHLKN